MGALAFLGGLAVLFAPPDASDATPARHLFELNAIIGIAVFYMALGGFLVFQAASALGNASSSPFAVRWPWMLLPLFPVFLVSGQYLAGHPETAPALFPFLNIAIVAIPSLSIAAVAAIRYGQANPLSWPVSWREWTGGFIYGAVGATTIAAVVNTGYLFGMAAVLVGRYGEGPALPLSRSLLTVPHGWAIFLDVSALSIVAPLNEELWKGLLVAVFFYRRGGAARCFLWGVLAGTGFNLLETFQNSIGAVDPDAVADRTIGSAWWWFATARAGTAAMHGLASGLSALGLFGLLHRQWRYLPGYATAVLLHGAWNLLVYLSWGDAIFSTRGPDTTALDVLGFFALTGVFVACVAMLWILPGQLRDAWPAPMYDLLGMRPGNPGGTIAALVAHGSAAAAGANTPTKDSS